MRYTVTTFKVRLEVCDVGERTGASDDVVRVARPIFVELDADKEHFLLLALNNKNRINGFKVISFVRRNPSALSINPSRPPPDQLAIRQI